MKTEPIHEGSVFHCKTMVCGFPIYQANKNLVPYKLIPDGAIKNVQTGNPYRKSEPIQCLKCLTGYSSLELNDPNNWKVPFVEI